MQWSSHTSQEKQNIGRSLLTQVWAAVRHGCCSTNRGQREEPITIGRLRPPTEAHWSNRIRWKWNSSIVYSLASHLLSLWEDRSWLTWLHTGSVSPAYEELLSRLQTVTITIIYFSNHRIKLISPNPKDTVFGFLWAPSHPHAGGVCTCSLSLLKKSFKLHLRKQPVDGSWPRVASWSTCVYMDLPTDTKCVGKNWSHCLHLAKKNFNKHKENLGIYNRQIKLSY